MAPKKDTDTTQAPEETTNTETVEADPVPEVESDTTSPTAEAIQAERERTDDEHHPQLPDAVNSEGEIISTGDQPPADVQIEDMRAMIAPPATSSYVTFPAHLRDETDNDRAEDHTTDIKDAANNKIGERGHWVQVVQVRTFDTSRVPQVSLRCECNREYTVDWTGDRAEEIVRVSRT